MAKMYSRARGKAGSLKPFKRTAPTWINYKPKEVEQLVLKISKSGLSPSLIGLTLRDSYGIPDVKSAAGKSITEILKENNSMTKLPEDITALIRHHIQLTKHTDSNKQDMPAKRGLQITESKINKLAKYYIRTGKIAAGWKFEASKAKLLIE